MKERAHVNNNYSEHDDVFCRRRNNVNDCGRSATIIGQAFTRSRYFRNRTCDYYGNNSMEPYLLRVLQAEANERAATDMLKKNYPLDAIKDISRLPESAIRKLAKSLGVAVVL